MASQKQHPAPTECSAALLPTIILLTGAATLMMLLLTNVVLAAVPVVQTYRDGTDDDQDDVAFWVHPVDASQTTVIGSDKGAGRVYVYDLDGSVIQTIDSPKPGNIDVRYGFQLGNDCVDLVAYNERGEEALRVYKVDPDSRRLTRVDDGAIDTGANYGFTLYRHGDGRLFAHTGPKSSGSLIKQYELRDDGSGEITGVATGWEFDESTVEGMVGDDETGYIYLAEESEGIWRVDAMDDSDKTLIAAEGTSSGLAADVEGITIYYAAGGQGYIIASSQGNDTFTVFERTPPHDPVGTFEISGVGSTDGIDVLNMDLGSTFRSGIFAAHNGEACCPIEATSWDRIASELDGLTVDTAYWDPRQSNRSCDVQSPTECVEPLTLAECVVTARHSKKTGAFDAARVKCTAVDAPGGSFDPSDAGMFLTMGDAGGTCLTRAMTSAQCAQKGNALTCKDSSRRFKVKIAPWSSAPYKLIARVRKVDLECLEHEQSPWVVGFAVGDYCGDVGCPVDGKKALCPDSCGNGISDPGEQCDGTDLGGNTCTSLGFDGGSLACSPVCLLDVADCS